MDARVPDAVVARVEVGRTAVGQVQLGDLVVGQLRIDDARVAERSGQALLRDLQVSVGLECRASLSADLIELGSARVPFEVHNLTLADVGLHIIDVPTITVAQS
jgi:hypothetical protein